MANYLSSATAAPLSERGGDARAPYLVAALFAMTIFGFYGALLPFGFLGIVGGAAAGLLWAFLVGLAAQRLMRRTTWHARLANASVFVSILAVGLMAGAGAMYIAMMLAAVDEPSMTYAVLSALMQPAVPFYIVLNSLLELLVMLLVVFSNWQAGRKRRLYSLAGVGLYLVMRIWTYLVYAEMRLEISTHTLSAADVAWFKQTLAADYRPGLVLLILACFVLAAFAPVTRGESD
ncbi:MAG: hypothetical protein IT329_11515 [Caldilineaceae bacterium]|nr:hypothetical protein [Caldilineaceae bacterium]